MQEYVFYVKFEKEISHATHYLSVEEVTIKAVTQDGDMASMNSEVYQFIRTVYPDRKVRSVQGFAR